MKRKTIGEKLKIFMKNEGINQSELAQKLGIDRRNVSKTLKMFDENKGGIKTLLEYCQALDINFNFFFDKNIEEPKTLEGKISELQRKKEFLINEEVYFNNLQNSEEIEKINLEIESLKNQLKNATEDTQKMPLI